jgi:hypothetical protein
MPSACLKSLAACEIVPHVPCETVAVLLIWCLCCVRTTPVPRDNRYKPEVSQQQLFNFSPTKPFQRGTGWLAWGLMGVAAAPVVVGSTALLLSAVGYDAVVAGGRGTVDGVAGMVTLDLPTYVRLVSVTGEIMSGRLVTGSSAALLFDCEAEAGSSQFAAFDSAQRTVCLHACMHACLFAHLFGLQGGCERKA